jgi:Icc-related predicted phosphoesterase
MLRIVCVSDTHGSHRKTVMPPGDILIHAGDLTKYGWLEEVEEFNDWLGTLNHLYRYKIVIAGNHDFCFAERPNEARARITNATYLEDTATVVEGIKIYGSPWQPWFGGWAFNLPRGPESAAVWAKIPDDTDILITHGPPEGILDQNRRGDCCGCRDLLDRVVGLRLRLHVFGHIHEAAGQLDIGGTTFVNASTILGHGSAIVIEWPGSA